MEKSETSHCGATVAAQRDVSLFFKFGLNKKLLSLDPDFSTFPVLKYRAEYRGSREVVRVLKRRSRLLSVKKKTGGPPALIPLSRNSYVLLEGLILKYPDGGVG